MKPTTIPLICGISLAAMLAAGASHWWSVRQFTGIFNHGIPLQAPPAQTPEDAASQQLLAEHPAPVAPASIATFKQADAGRQKEFYEALIEKLARVETQNRDLLDQLAETNRDLMKLEFRVDTHSESFRPLPLVEEKPFSSLDADTGVLPPRATPAGLPSFE